MNKKILMVLCAIFFVVPIAFMSTGCNNNKTDTYSITYVINGGTNNKKNPTTFNENSNTILLLDPSRKGYSFDGWFFDEEFTNKVTTIASSIQTDVTLYAKWSAKDYKITYILNGGTNNNLNPITYNVESETITLLEPTKEGYVFDGWYSNSTFSGEQVTNINNGSIGTKRFYAKWSVVDYGITYILNGGTNNNLNPITYNIESETITLLEPTKEGYAFDGWYTNSNFTGNKIILIEEGCIGNKTLYAKFNEIFLYNNSGEITGLTSYGKTLSEINIPSQIDGAAIIKINQSAFLGHTSLTSIMIPNSVTSIGNSAFYRCGLLESVVFEENSKCQSIGDYAFYECSSLMSILLPSCIQSIDGRVFSGCGSLTSITIPSCVTSIEPYALSDCSSLINVIFEENSKCAKIGYNAFSGCESLTSINIPSSVTSIGDSAFEDCESLISITIPSSVTSMGAYVFDECSNLQHIILPFIGDAKLNPTQTHLKYIFEYNGGVPKSLKTVTILEGCQSVGKSAFSGCSSLTSISIPSTIKSIGENAFTGCNSLEYLKVDENNKIYDSRNNCNAIIETATNTLIFGCKNTIIPNSITSIGDEAFYCCESLVNVIFEENSKCQSIGSYAFAYCESLTSINIPSSVTSIGDCAFEACRDLTSIIIPSSVTSIGFYSFACCGIENITLPFIGDTKLNPTNTNFGYIFGAYSWSDNNKFVPTMLKSVTILEGCESIEDYAFRSCSSLESITIPESCESIGESAFAYCGKLTSIIIPNSVESIGDYAFRGCSSLASVTIPSDITSIESNTFMECYNLESLRVDENNKIYDSRNDCNAIIETATNTLIFGCKNTIIPNSITSIGDSAFEICRLINIFIPNSVTNIGNSAFASCLLSNVIFEENSTCESIGESAFAYCSNLTSIIIPNSVESIGDYAFRGCSSLASVTIPSGVTSIGSNTFMACYNLESLRVDENNNIYDSRNDCNAIIETATNTLIFGCKNTIIPNNITSIGDSAFEDCRDLTTIIIPSSVTSIGNRAFNECRSLSNVIFEENSTCESIGESAFAYCRSLTCIMIPNSVIIIKLQAFYECESLESAIFEVVYPWYKVYSTSNQKELVVSKYLEDASNAAKFLVEYDLVYWKRA